MKYSKSRPTSERTETSIIILNFNGKKFLETCLDSVFQSKEQNFEVIFVDNASSDGSVDLIREKFGDRANLKIVSCEKNFGYSMGNNIGARHARGKYLVFLNPDTWVEPSWIHSLIEVLDSDSSIGIAQAKLLRDENTIDSVGGELNCYGFGRIRGQNEVNNRKYDEVNDIFYPTGAAFIIKRKKWELIGGFDPIYFVSFEDADLGWRMWDSGYRVVIAPRSVVYHKRRAITGKYPTIYRYFSLRNRIIILVKNHSLKNLIRFLPVTITIYVFNIFKQFFSRNAKEVLIEVKSILWCLFFFKKIWKSRMQRMQMFPPSAASLRMMSKYLFGEKLKDLLRA